MRSRDCQRVDALLRLECERARARGIDPAVVAAAEEIEREQALMKWAVQRTSLPGAVVVRYQAIDTPPQLWGRREKSVAKADTYVMLEREALEVEDAQTDASTQLRMTRMAPADAVY